MAGTARTRTRPSKYCTGYSIKFGNTATRNVVAELSEQCTDVVGNPHGDNPFYTNTGKSNWATLNGNNGGVGILKYREYFNWFPTVIWPSAAFPTYNTSEMATLLLARTNPGRSYIKLPVFLFELKELPRLILIAGRSVAKTFANANLAWQFGWTPLLADLRRMFNFQESVARRVNELERLQSKSGLKRRTTLKSWEDSSRQQGVYVENVVSIVRANTLEMLSQKVWGTVRWVPSPSASLPSTDLERLTMARKMVLGFGPGQNLANVWEGLPWSWLIDWFSNVGDFIEATNNSVAMPVGKCNIMVHNKATRTYSVTVKQPWVEISPSSPETYREGKHRFVSSSIPRIHFSLPFLTIRQLSILGSLWIQRKR